MKSTVTGLPRCWHEFIMSIYFSSFFKYNCFVSLYHFWHYCDEIILYLGLMLAIACEPVQLYRVIFFKVMISVQSKFVSWHFSLRQIPLLDCITLKMNIPLLIPCVSTLKCEVMFWRLQTALFSTVNVTVSVCCLQCTSHHMLVTVMDNDSRAPVLVE